MWTMILYEISSKYYWNYLQLNLILSYIKTFICDKMNNKKTIVILIECLSIIFSTVALFGASFMGFNDRDIGRSILLGALIWLLTFDYLIYRFVDNSIYYSNSIFYHGILQVPRILLYLFGSIALLSFIRQFF
jgi:hypothetical protein